MTAAQQLREQARHAHPSQPTRVGRLLQIRIDDNAQAAGGKHAAHVRRRHQQLLVGGVVARVGRNHDARPARVRRAGRGEPIDSTKLPATHTQSTKRQQHSSSRRSRLRAAARGCARLRAAARGARGAHHVIAFASSACVRSMQS